MHSSVPAAAEPATHTEKAFSRMSGHASLSRWRSLKDPHSSDGQYSMPRTTRHGLMSRGGGRVQPLAPAEIEGMGSALILLVEF